MQNRDSAERFPGEPAHGWTHCVTRTAYRPARVFPRMNAQNASSSFDSERHDVDRSNRQLVRSLANQSEEHAVARPVPARHRGLAMAASVARAP